MNKVFDKKNIILVSIDEEDLMSFLVDSDLMDDGKYDWRIDELVDEIIDVVPEYVFADYIGANLPMTEAISKIREAARCIYKVEEYELMRKYCMEDDTSILDVMQSKGYKSRGEFGEFLLHLLLRDFKGTIPLVSKVYFKDSANVPAHGFDAVHISLNEKILWLGESKLYVNVKPGLVELVKDLQNHIKRNYLDDQFIIIKKNIENNTIPQRKRWIEILDDCSKMSERLNIINIPMLCVYEDDIYDKFPNVNDLQALEYHQKSVRELKSYFNAKTEHPLKKEMNIILFLFPVKNKDMFVRKLHERLWHMQNL